MMNKNEKKSIAVDMVFAIEATANMASNFDAIKKNYIVPILKHFEDRSKPNTEIVNSNHSIRYVAVLFHSADQRPGHLTQCFLPVTNSQEFLKILDNIELKGGASETSAHITEGLATVLQAFMDLKEQESSKIVERFCFVISNSPPYRHNCVESYNYNGLSLNQIGEKFFENEIKLSIICPRHINSLRTLFIATSKIQSNLLNYAQDRRHLVLISGFSMPTEREPYPLIENSEQTEMNVVEPTEVNNESIYKILSPPNETTLNRNQLIGHEVRPQQRLVPAQKPPNPMVYAPKQPTRPIQTVPENQNFDKAREAADKILQAAASKPKFIWEGQIEWSLRLRNAHYNGQPPPRKIVACKIYQQVTSGQQDINTTHWQQKFTLSFIAPHLMQSVHDLMKPIAKIFFHFTPSAVPQLVESFQKQYGVVTLFSRPQNEEPKHAFVLCHQKNDDNSCIFQGFIPKNSTQILHALKKIYNNQSQHSQIRYPNQANRQYNVPPNTNVAVSNSINLVSSQPTNIRMNNIPGKSPHAAIQQRSHLGNAEIHTMQNQHNIQMSSINSSTMPSNSMTSGFNQMINTSINNNKPTTQMHMPNNISAGNRSTTHDPNMQRIMSHENSQVTGSINSQLSLNRQANNVQMQQQQTYMQHSNMISNNRRY